MLTTTSATCPDCRRPAPVGVPCLACAEDREAAQAQARAPRACFTCSAPLALGEMVVCAGCVDRAEAAL